MKHSTVTVKVILKVEVPVEQDDDDNRAPELEAVSTIKNTSLRQWHRYVDDYETVSVEVAKVTIEPEE